jgi:hypothetical protein
VRVLAHLFSAEDYSDDPTRCIVRIA